VDDDSVHRFVLDKAACMRCEHGCRDAFVRKRACQPQNEGSGGIVDGAWKGVCKEKDVHAMARVALPTAPPFDVPSPSPSQLVEVALKLAKLRALTGDLLTKQSHREEDAAKDEARLNDRPHPTLTDPVHQQSGDGNQPGNDADEENRHADHAKEQKWLLSKTELEPNGQHIKQANGNTRDTELRAASMARVQWDRHLADDESLRGCYRHHVSVPIRAEWQCLHHFSAVRLHGVEVFHLHVKELPTEPVVDAGDERLFVVTLLEAGHDIGVAGEHRSG
jgi:hypothetical protein